MEIDFLKEENNYLSKVIQEIINKLWKFYNENLDELEDDEFEERFAKLIQEIEGM